MTKHRFDSVWDALENTPADAANMQARADIMIAIRDVIDRWDVTQAQAAKRLGITQPRMNDLLRGRVDKFSLDAFQSCYRRRSHRQMLYRSQRGLNLKSGVGHNSPTKRHPREGGHDGAVVKGSACPKRAYRSAASHPPMPTPIAPCASKL
jgi:predicted XRE-type DNA-binding protein